MLFRLKLIHAKVGFYVAGLLCLSRRSTGIPEVELGIGRSVVKKLIQNDDTTFMNRFVISCQLLCYLQ